MNLLDRKRLSLGMGTGMNNMLQKKWMNSYSDFKFNPGVYKRRLSTLQSSLTSSKSEKKPGDDDEESNNYNYIPPDENSLVAGFKVGFGSIVENNYRRRKLQENNAAIDTGWQGFEDCNQSGNHSYCNSESGHHFVDDEGNYHRDIRAGTREFEKKMFPYLDDSNVFQKMYPIKPWYSAKYFSFNPKKRPGTYNRYNSFVGLHQGRIDPEDHHMPNKRWNLVARCCEYISTTVGCQLNTWDDFIVDGKNLDFDFSKRLGYYDGLVPANLLGMQRATEHFDSLQALSVGGISEEDSPYIMDRMNDKTMVDKDLTDTTNSPYWAGFEPTPYRCLDLPDKCEDNVQYHSCTDSGALIGCQWSATHEWDPSGKWSAYRMTGDLHDE